MKMTLTLVAFLDVSVKSQCIETCITLDTVVAR